MNGISTGKPINTEVKKELIALYGGFRLTMYGTNCESAARHFLSVALNIGYYVPDTLPIILKEVWDPLYSWGLDSNSIIPWVESELAKPEHYTVPARDCYMNHKDIIEDCILGRNLKFSI